MLWRQKQKIYLQKSKQKHVFQLQMQLSRVLPEQEIYIDVQTLPLGVNKLEYYATFLTFDLRLM